MAATIPNRVSRELRPVEHQHRFRLRRHVSPIEWASFLAVLPSVPLLAAEGALGEAPNPRYLGAPQDAFRLTVDAVGVQIGGRGLWRPAGGSRAVSLHGTGPWGLLALEPRLPRAFNGLCITGGRPYDNAVRLALLLLSACAPGAVELSSTGREDHWAATAYLASSLMDVQVDPPLTVRRAVPRDVLLCDAEPAGDGLWRARWRQAEVMPRGPEAVVRAGRCGFASRDAALAAAMEVERSHSRRPAARL